MEPFFPGLHNSFDFTPNVINFYSRLIFGVNKVTHVGLKLMIEVLGIDLAVAGVL